MGVLESHKLRDRSERPKAFSFGFEERINCVHFQLVGKLRNND